MKDYPVVRNQPVAKFFYKGQSHTHPVKRTVVLIESHPNYFRGFELREGTDVRPLGRAPIKSYSRKNIAKIREIDARRELRATTPSAKQDSTTLKRFSFADLVRQGV